MNIVLWIVQALLALTFVFAGANKAFAPFERVKKLFPWAAAVPRGLVRFIGVAELLGGLGLILPAATGLATGLTVAAAAGLALIMLLAAGFHASRREYPNIGVNVALLLLALFIVVGRLAWSPF